MWGWFDCTYLSEVKKRAVLPSTTAVTSKLNHDRIPCFANWKWDTLFLVCYLVPLFISRSSCVPLNDIALVSHDVPWVVTVMLPPIPFLSLQLCPHAFSSSVTNTVYLHPPWISVTVNSGSDEFTQFQVAVTGFWKPQPLPIDPLVHVSHQWEVKYSSWGLMAGSPSNQAAHYWVVCQPCPKPYHTTSVISHVLFDKSLAHSFLCRSVPITIRPLDP